MNLLHEGRISKLSAQANNKKMGIKNQKFIFLFLILLVQAHLTGQTKSSKKILFIGNSYTYFWNLSP